MNTTPHTTQLFEQGLIPLDKSWTNRMGILDLKGSSDRTIRFLEGKSDLPDDLKALLRASRAWISGERNIDVGESGTLLRCLRFLAWTRGLKETFVVHNTLKKRVEEGCITNDPAIIHFSLEELLKLDNGTSQWATAALLARDSCEPVAHPSFRLLQTYEAVEHWHATNKAGQHWQAKHDDTIAKQAGAFLQMLLGLESGFVPAHSEDYCFARAFEIIDATEGLKRYPSLVGHESNRIAEMEETFRLYSEGMPIPSRDHRVVQAISMRALLDRKSIRIDHADCVNKGWPQFWNFMKYAEGSM
ncbi:MAG: hypothetical protein JWP09_802 [Candidatus Taylorbacteria bacterium]|nr:hypothetical protein [Candidatus Taylorbacteria bacterium]